METDKPMKKRLIRSCAKFDADMENVNCKIGTRHLRTLIAKMHCASDRLEVLNLLAAARVLL